MTPLLLDTHIISDMMRDLQGPAARRAMAINQLDGVRPLCTSVVVQCELEFGLARRKNARLEVAYHGVMATVDVLPLDEKVVEHYARLRIQLEAIGQPIGPNDALIAAHALALNATLVSADAEFLRVPGLRVENWLKEEAIKEGARDESK